MVHTRSPLAPNSLCDVVADPATMNGVQEVLLHSSIVQHGLEADKDDLRRRVAEREQQLDDTRRELIGRDRLIQQQKSQLDEAVRNLSLANKAKAFLTTQLADQDRKLALLEQYRDPRPLMREELQVARDALQSLRRSFKHNDPHHHTIDTLEQSIALLMERLHFAELQKVISENMIGKRLNYDIHGSSRRSALTLPSICQAPVLYNGMNGTYLTKVVYFTEHAITPFMSSIPKRLGEVTLRDFKLLLDKPGNYRYHFKSVDPEYGMVKEEIMHDDEVLPGWDGKIVAWVEGDHG